MVSTSWNRRKYRSDEGEKRKDNNKRDRTKRERSKIKPSYGGFWPCSTPRTDRKVSEPHATASSPTELPLCSQYRCSHRELHRSRKNLLWKTMNRSITDKKRERGWKGREDERRWKSGRVGQTLLAESARLAVNIEVRWKSFTTKEPSS